MIFRVSSHAGYVGAQSTYVVIKGKAFDGADFISQALERGATKIVVQRDQLTDSIKQLCNKKHAELFVVDDTRKALAELSAQAYGYPAKKLKILAVTGTDGKTTSTYLLYRMLKQAGKKVALLSGVQNIVAEQEIKADLTTAKPDFLHYFFDLCVQQKVEYVAMEVSAQAASLHRIDGLTFAGCIFTNLAHEHGENYANLDDYFDAKCAILAQKDSQAPLVVHDTPWTLKVKQRFGKAFVCGFTSSADYQVTCLQETLKKQFLEINIGKTRYQLESALIGDYNALNITGAFALVSQFGVKPEHISAAVRSFDGAQGRLERYLLPRDVTAIIDYAHTPQAYMAILARLKRYARRLVVVFGAAGGKDVAKRPKMGKIAVSYADLIVITNDNPRHEDPAVIMNQVMAEFSDQERTRVLCEQDRARAIACAYQSCQAGDIIAILGKGGESVQIIGKQRLPYSDEQVVRGLMTS